MYLLFQAARPIKTCRQTQANYIYKLYNYKATNYRLTTKQTVNNQLSYYHSFSIKVKM